MSRWVALVVLSGCYSPSIQSGLPCSEDGSCPPGQTCDVSRSPPTCEDTLGDGGVALDGDAPPSCASGCGDTTPVCDPQAQTCRGCIADAECSSDVCHELTGECVPEGHAIYLAPNGGGNDCTRIAPCARFSDANDQVTAVRNTIKVADGRYNDRLELKSQNTAVNIIVSGPDRSWDGPEIVAGLSGNRVDQNLVVVIEGVSLINSSGHGLDSLAAVTLSRVLVRNSASTGVTGRGPTTRILDSRIEGSMGRGVQTNNGTGTIERTVIIGNLGGGLSFENGAAYSVVNTIIASNGDISKPNPGVRFSGGLGQPGALAVFRFNTVASNRTDVLSTSGVECNRPVTIESSIMANRPGTFGAEMSELCTAQSSLFASSPPSGNLGGDPRFVSATDFHILAGSPAVDAAPIAAAPSVDIDGNPRTGDPDIGADELP